MGRGFSCERKGLVVGREEAAIWAGTSYVSGLGGRRLSGPPRWARLSAHVGTCRTRALLASWWEPEEPRPLTENHSSGQFIKKKEKTPNHTPHHTHKMTVWSPFLSFLLASWSWRMNEVGEGMG